MKYILHQETYLWDLIDVHTLLFKAALYAGICFQVDANTCCEQFFSHTFVSQHLPLSCHLPLTQAVLITKSLQHCMDLGFDVFHRRESLFGFVYCISTKMSGLQAPIWRFVGRPKLSPSFSFYLQSVRNNLTGKHKTILLRWPSAPIYSNSSICSHLLKNAQPPLQPSSPRVSLPFRPQAAILATKHPLWPPQKAH